MQTPIAIRQLLISKRKQFTIHVLEERYTNSLKERMIKGANKRTRERTSNKRMNERTKAFVYAHLFRDHLPRPPPQPRRAPQIAQPAGVTRNEPKPRSAKPAVLASLARPGARYSVEKAIYSRENSCFRLESQNLQQHCFFPVASDEKLWVCLASTNFVDAFLRDKKTSDQGVSCDVPLWDRVSISCSESL